MTTVPSEPVETKIQNGAKKPMENAPALTGPRLPFHPAVEERFGVDRAAWKALVEAIFPNATTVESVILALSYCRARKLDPFKRNVHIVPIWNKQLGRMIDTVWPGIGELRTTAFRTGEYAGRGESVFGPTVTAKVGKLEAFTFPEWCQVTVHRFIKGQKVAFAGPKVYWLETYATYKRDDDTPNEMWMNRPFGQIDKCAEAAALRAGFPEEVGSEYIPEEVEHGPRRQSPGGLASLPTGRSSFKDEVEIVAESPSGNIDPETGEVREVEQPDDGAILTRQGALELAKHTATPDEEARRAQAEAMLKKDEAKEAPAATEAKPAKADPPADKNGPALNFGGKGRKV